MKPSPQQRLIEQRMAPGVLCRDGFLGTDGRPLDEILDTDRSTVQALGLTHAQIAAPLRDVMEEAMRRYGNPVILDRTMRRPATYGTLRAVYREGMGRIPSPFADGLFPKGEIELTDVKTGEAVTFTPLSVHLIAEHGFYEGRGGRYRLEPDAVARLFGLEAPP